jgi:hypothetical protein
MCQAESSLAEMLHVVEHRAGLVGDVAPALLERARAGEVGVLVEERRRMDEDPVEATEATRGELERRGHRDGDQLGRSCVR